MKKFICCKKAFTLAEVLITIGIIGVVAAMTMPILINKISKNVLESQIKETYSILQQTMLHATANDSMFYKNFQDYSNTAMKLWFEEYVKPYIKTTSICYNSPGCWHKYDVAHDLKGNKNLYDNVNNIGWGVDIITFTISNGAYFDMDGHGISTCNNTFGINTDTTCLVIFFDANGDKQPNVVGKDIYVLVQTDKGLVPAGADKTDVQVNENCLNGDGYFCLKKLISDQWIIDDRVWDR